MGSGEAEMNIVEHEQRERDRNVGKEEWEPHWSTVFIQGRYVVGHGGWNQIYEGSWWAREGWC